MPIEGGTVDVVKLKDNKVSLTSDFHKPDGKEVFFLFTVVFRNSMGLRSQASFISDLVGWQAVLSTSDTEYEIIGEDKVLDDMTIKQRDEFKDWLEPCPQKK